MTEKIGLNSERTPISFQDLQLDEGFQGVMFIEGVEGSPKVSSRQGFREARSIKTASTRDKLTDLVFSFSFL